jgi:hypothetical protein
MADALPASLLQFIRHAVPTYQAAEVLLFFAANPERTFKPEGPPRHHGKQITDRWLRRIPVA